MSLHASELNPVIEAPNQNKDLIHSHFHQNTLPSELNQILRMPTQASDTTFHTTIQQHPTDDKQHINEGSQPPLFLE